jgi:signal transduction histidine kinase
VSRLTAALVGSPSREVLAHLLEPSDEGRVGRDLPLRSLVFDVVIMLTFLAMGVLLLTVMALHERPLDYLFVILVSAPLAFRRRFPRSSVFATFALAIIQQFSGILIGIYDAAVLFGLYSAVGYTNRRFGLIALGGAVVTVIIGAFTDWWRWIDLQVAGGAWIRPYSTLGALVLIFTGWALGERLRFARLGSIALAERADQLMREREQQALLAAAAERSRIAREMHDVIAHGLSVMIAQADGATYVVEQSPTQAKTSLQQISTTGREALGQMRDLLGLLRAAEGEAPGGQPQPALGDLDALVDQARVGGANVRLRTADDLDRLPALVSLTAYRIVQEGLTNARKHGGSDVTVTLDWVPGGLQLRVWDSGRGDDEPMVAAEPGHGLIGMRERVAAVGGTLTVRPTPDGGHEIVAWLPVEAGRP